MTGSPSLAITLSALPSGIPGDYSYLTLCLGSWYFGAGLYYMFFAIPCCTVLYYTVPYYTILYYTILYYTILYYTILYYTILYYTILYYTILYYTILYYTILYCTKLYDTILDMTEHIMTKLQGLSCFHASWQGGQQAFDAR